MDMVIASVYARTPMMWLRRCCARDISAGLLVATCGMDSPRPSFCSYLIVRVYYNQIHCSTVIFLTSNFNTKEKTLLTCEYMYV